VSGSRRVGSWVFLLAVLALPACTAIKAGMTRATTDFATLQTETPAGVYKSDPDHTTLHFKVRHFNFSTFVARFDKVSATLQWDPADPAKSHLEAVVDTASVDTRVPTLDAQLRSDQMFDSAASPVARFVSTRIIRMSNTSGEVRGNLTIKGQTHPVTLKVVFNGGGVNGLTGKSTLGFSAHAQIRRSEWGLGAWFPVVGDEVELEIETELVKAN
jgi:polyisoprenoid-binding protein YceI